MKKIQAFILATALFLVTGGNALAGYASAQFDEQNDRMKVTFNPEGITQYKVTQYTATGQFITEMLWQGSGMVTGTHYLRCNGQADFVFYNSSGVVATDTINVTQIIFEADSCEPAPGDQETETPALPEKEQGCIGCGLFECPGWLDFMGGLGEIKDAIPPAPDWQDVSETFRDTIAPKIKEDLQEVLGEVPEPPAAPEAPAAPPLPPDLDDGGLEAPTGEEAPGLGESTFDYEDIKEGAPEIPIREDPTDGFTIDNPVDMLPSQEEFMQNLPNEGSAPLPANPKEEDNPAPFPKDEGATAPMPGDEGASAPIPKDDGATAPTPGNDGATAPLPGQSNETAPLPGGG
ncbi:hypothetical protein V4V35_25405 [Bacillus infantis]|uniref:hypothetical protein n=1 Tax=Bacillus infantis TaxID=324767 RepID=UPI002FBE6C79